MTIIPLPVSLMTSSPNGNAGMQSRRSLRSSGQWFVDSLVIERISMILGFTELSSLSNLEWKSRNSSCWFLPKASKCNSAINDEIQKLISLISTNFQAIRPWNGRVDFFLAAVQWYFSCHVPHHTSLPPVTNSETNCRSDDRYIVWTQTSCLSWPPLKDRK